LNDEAVLKAVGKVYRAGLESLKKRSRRPSERRAVTVRLACVYAAFLGCAPVSGAEAFITDQTGDEVSVLDLGSKHVVARIPVLGKPAGIAMARDGRTAYVTSTEGKYVSVIDTASRNIVSKIPIPDTPLGIAADPAGRFIYVAGSISLASIRSTSRPAPSPPASRLARRRREWP
jgi:YVTN family beta-propeller protein